MSLNIYIPRDERFGHLKLSDFLAYALKSVAQVLTPELESVFDKTPSEFDSFQDVMDLYEGGIELPKGLLKHIREKIPAEMLKEIFRTDGEQLLKFPLPQVVKGTAISQPSKLVILFKYEALINIRTRVSRVMRVGGEPHM